MNLITKSALTVLLSLPLGFASAYENGHDKSLQKMDSKEIAQSVAFRGGFGRSEGRGYHGNGYRYDERGEWRGDGYGYYGYPRYGYYPTPYYEAPYYYHYNNPSRDDQNTEYYYYGY